MSKSMIGRGMLVAAAAAATFGALAAPQVAAAQPYGYGYSGPSYGGAYYDPCRRDRTNRGVAGALIGGALGAVVGSQAAANHHRTDGSLLGGGLGAIAGGMVGSSSAACSAGSQYYPGAAPPPPAPPPPPPQGYYGRPPPPPAYDDGQRWGSRWDDDDADHWAYGRRGERYRIAERPTGPDGCTLAESPIYMPDGRVEKRMVRVCRDRSGRFQVVN
jgi:hypothetical protein